MKIGKKLKALRKQKKVTLEELSKRSGVQVATLSRIENDVMTGTLDSHINICKALGISLSDFYREIEYDQKEIFLKKGKEAPSLIRKKKTAAEVLTTNVNDKKMIPLLVKLPKDGETSSEQHKVGSEKFIYVVEGKVKIKIGKDEYDLSKGDSIYFDASLPHAFCNTGKNEARIINVLSPR